MEYKKDFMANVNNENASEITDILYLFKHFCADFGIRPASNEQLAFISETFFSISHSVDKIKEFFRYWDNAVNKDYPKAPTKYDLQHYLSRDNKDTSINKNYCPMGICDGSRWILYTRLDEDIASPCSCNKKFEEFHPGKKPPSTLFDMHKFIRDLRSVKYGIYFNFYEVK
jgi:hypothetical protein